LGKKGEGVEKRKGGKGREKWRKRTLDRFLYKSNPAHNMMQKAKM